MKITADQVTDFLLTLNRNSPDATYEVFQGVRVDGLTVTAYDWDDLYLSGPVTTWTAQSEAEAAEFKTNEGRAVYRVTHAPEWDHRNRYDEERNVEVFAAVDVRLYVMIPGVE